MDEKQIRLYNAFRSLCLRNAEDALRAAEILCGNKLNHLALHLSLLCLEEVGKVLVGWLQISSEDEWGKDVDNHSIEDHTKKIFWAIWGPLLLKDPQVHEKFSELKGFAGELHARRLEVLYTSLRDTKAGAEKVLHEEAAEWMNLAKSRLEFEKQRGELIASVDANKDADLSWLAISIDDQAKRSHILSKGSLDKLNELGNSKDWIHWLQAHFESERVRLKALLDAELARNTTGEPKGKPRWKFRLKIVTPSHSIRPQVLKPFNAQCDFINLHRGGDPHTLHVDLVLFSNIDIKHVFHHGWTMAKSLVAALNVGNSGFFYWNSTIDTSKYYEKLWDLETNTQLNAQLAEELRFDWKEQKLVLDEKGIGFTLAALGYFLRIARTKQFVPVDMYMTGLAMFAKTDIHLRMERETFFQFFVALREGLLLHREEAAKANLSKCLIEEIGGIYPDSQHIERAVDSGLQMLNAQKSTSTITLTEVLQMKQYCDAYLLTLALREATGKQDLKLALLK